MNNQIPEKEVDEKIETLIKSGNPKFEKIGRQLCAMQTLKARHAALNLVLLIANQ